jgi:hypothetical protein
MEDLPTFPILTKAVIIETRFRPNLFVSQRLRLLVPIFHLQLSFASQHVLDQHMVVESLALAEYILTFQVHNMLCANVARNVDDFCAYDFVGAPIVAFAWQRLQWKAVLEEKKFHHGHLESMGLIADESKW